MFSDNKRFVLKTVKPAEEKLLFAPKNGVLPFYYQYVASNERNLLSKLLGIFKVKLQMMETPVTFVIMDSLIGPEYWRIERLYDLKGSSHKRFTKLTRDEEENGSGLKTLKCQNFAGLDISEQARDDVLALLEADSQFLAVHNLSDYSLLVLKIRDLKEGETDQVKEQALQIDENGVF